MNLWLKELAKKMIRSNPTISHEIVDAKTGKVLWSTMEWVDEYFKKGGTR